jgi:hypothetical protein
MPDSGTLASPVLMSGNEATLVLIVQSSFNCQVWRFVRGVLAGAVQSTLHSLLPSLEYASRVQVKDPTKPAPERLSEPLRLPLASSLSVGDSPLPKPAKRLSGARRVEPSAAKLRERVSFKA